MDTVLDESGIDVADALRTVAVNSSYNASRALSKWFRRGVRLRADGFESIPISELAHVAGPPEEPVAAAHMMLVPTRTSSSTWAGLWSAEV